MQSSQIDLLLNQLLECSFNIYNAIKNNDTLELDALINIKNEKLQLIESNKKFCLDFKQFDEKIEQIKKQEQINLELLENKKNELAHLYKKTTATAKVLNKYEINDKSNGSIIDIRE